MAVFPSLEEEEVEPEDNEGGNMVHTPIMQGSHHMQLNKSKEMYKDILQDDNE